MHPNKSFPQAKAETPVQTGPDYIRVMCVFATNQCNLACIQCCAPTIKTAKGATHLSWENFRGAIDVFMDPKHTPYRGQKVISIQGGEPFLVYPILVRALKYAKKFPRPPMFSIHTNGTLAKPEQLLELQQLGAEILFSLDGKKEDNDRFRRFANNGPSVWQLVMDKIKDLPKKGMGINMTIRPETLDGTIEGMEAFSKAGMKLINIEPDCYHPWNTEDLKRLGVFFQQLADYYVGRTGKEGSCPFHIGTLHDGIQRAAILNQGKKWWKECTQLILGSDGNFYNCEASNFYDYNAPKEFNWRGVAQTHGINHAGAGEGVDWKKRQQYMNEADEALGELSPDIEWQIICPRLYYSMDKNNEIAGKKGKELMEMAEVTHRLSRVFHKGMLQLAARLRDNPSFKKMYIDTPVVQGF